MYESLGEAPLLRSISKVSSCFFGPRPWHIEIRHRVQKTSTIDLFGFETLKLKIRRLKLWKPTVIVGGNILGWRRLHPVSITRFIRKNKFKQENKKVTKITKERQTKKTNKNMKNKNINRYKTWPYTRSPLLLSFIGLHREYIRLTSSSSSSSSSSSCIVVIIYWIIITSYDYYY